jgi:hypothetical protein
MFAKDGVEALLGVLRSDDPKAFAGERRGKQFETAGVVVDDDHLYVGFGVH